MPPPPPTLPSHRADWAGDGGQREVPGGPDLDGRRNEQNQLRMPASGTEGPAPAVARRRAVSGKDLHPGRGPRRGNYLADPQRPVRRCREVGGHRTSGCSSGSPRSNSPSSSQTLTTTGDSALVLAPHGRPDPRRVREDAPGLRSWCPLPARTSIRGRRGTTSWTPRRCAEHCAAHRRFVRGMAWPGVRRAHRHTTPSRALGRRPRAPVTSGRVRPVGRPCCGPVDPGGYIPMPSEVLLRGRRWAAAVVGPAEAGPADAQWAS